MSYSGESRMAGFSGSGGTAAYTYDGNGMRVVKSVTSGTTTVSIYSGSSVLAEDDNGAAPSAPSREYIYNSAGGETTGLLAMISGTATTYYHQDHLSVRLTTDDTVGSSTYGQVLSQEGHLPYGEPWYPVGRGQQVVLHQLRPRFGERTGLRAGALLRQPDGNLLLRRPARRVTRRSADG